MPVAAGFGLVFWKIWRDRRLGSNARQSLLQQEVRLRLGVSVKPEMLAGQWSLKTQSGLELVVRANGFQITGKGALRPLMGVLGSEWFFVGSETVMETIKISDPSRLHTVDGDWIACANDSGGKVVRVAFHGRSGMRNAWDALTQAGVQTLGGPPED